MSTGRRAATAVAAVFALSVGACGDTGFESGHRLEVSLEVEAADRPLGAEHNFRIDARGRALVGLILDYGDAQVDSVATHGAQTATHHQPYVYGEEGVYLVRVRAEDADGEEASDSLTVRVDPPA